MLKQVGREDVVEMMIFNGRCIQQVIGFEPTLSTYQLKFVLPLTQS